MTKKKNRRNSISKKIVGMLLVLLLLFGMTGNVFAAGEDGLQSSELTAPSEYYHSTEDLTSNDNAIEPRYNRILKISGSIDVDAEKNTGSFTASVTAQTGKATSTHVKAIIQRKIGTTWRDYKTYNLTGDSWRAYWIGNKIALEDGYLYRLKVVGTVYYNNLSESDILYTVEKRV